MTDTPTLFDLAADDAAAYRTASPLALAAARAVQGAPQALVKWVTANDAGATGSHQAGFHLPRDSWPLFFDRAGLDGENMDNDDLEIDWFGHTKTASRAIWYGRETRSEYRLTRFGRGFPFRGEEHVGSLLVLVPVEPHRRYRAFVLSSEEDITDFFGSLGLSAADIGSGARVDPGDEGCLDRLQGDLLDRHSEFPTTRKMSRYAQDLAAACRGTTADDPDHAITAWTDVEYRLFRAFEDREFSRELAAGSIEDVHRLISLALPFTNRRKARAGRSFEHHFAACLEHRGLPFTAQANTEGANTMDFVFPSEEAYQDPDYPDDSLVVCGAKTSAKERWRQILEEADRVPAKHLLTLQPIAAATVRQMDERGIRVVVPRPYQRDFDPEARTLLWTVDEFMSHVADTIAR